MQSRRSKALLESSAEGIATGLSIDNTECLQSPQGDPLYVNTSALGHN